MFDFFDFQEGVTNVLKEHKDIGQSGVQVSMDEAVNEDPQRTPWIGVYRNTNRYDTRTLGAGNLERWEATPSLIIICQEASLKTGADCGRKLETLVRNTLRVLFTDGLLDAEVTPAMLNEVQTDYAYSPVDDEGQRALHYQSAIVTLTLTVEND